MFWNTEAQKLTHGPHLSHLFSVSPPSLMFILVFMCSSLPWFVFVNSVAPRNILVAIIRQGAMQYFRIIWFKVMGSRNLHSINFPQIWYKDSIRVSDVNSGSLMHYLWFILLEFPVEICDGLHITTHEYDCDLITGFPFALLFTCTFTKVHELNGYNQGFWKISGYSLKCV